MAGADGSGHADARAWAAVVASSAISGSAFLFTSVAQNAFPPLTLTALRLVIGTALLLVVAAFWDGLREVRSLSLSQAAGLAAIGVMNTTAPYTLYACAMAKGVTVGTASALIGAVPLFAAALSTAVIPGAAAALCRPSRAGSLAVGVVGVGLVAAHREFLAGRGHHGEAGGLDGVALQVAGTALKGLAAVMTEAYNRRQICPISAFAQAPVQAGAGALVALSLSLLLDSRGATPEVLDPRGLATDGYAFFGRAMPGAWSGLLCLASLNSCAVYVLQFFLLQRLGAVRQTTAEQLALVLGVLEGALLKGDWRGVPAAQVALFVAGVAFVTAALWLALAPARAEAGGAGGQVTESPLVQVGPHAAACRDDEAAVKLVSEV